MKPKSTPLDWDQVEPRERATGHDPLGLSPADRQALGMTPARPLDITAPSTMGAEAALAELLADGGAIGKREPRRKAR